MESRQADPTVGLELSSWERRSAMPTTIAFPNPHRMTSQPTDSDWTESEPLATMPKKVGDHRTGTWVTEESEVVRVWFNERMRRKIYEVGWAHI